MAPIETLLRSARALVTQNQALSDFAPWPSDLTRKAIAPSPVPAIPHLVQDFTNIPMPPENAAFVDAVKSAADQLNWKQTYKVEEVGQDFLNRYGYVELIGPNGHFHSAVSRMFVAYWGCALDYPWHDHVAEEMYYVAAGSADFHIPGQTRRLMPGDTQFHQSSQPHAMTTRTKGDGILALIPWRGDGLDLEVQITKDM